MRPIASFTLHAVLATALVAFAATSAAAGPTGGKEEVYYTITLTNARAHQESKGQQLEVHSFQWGSASSVAKVDSFAVKQGVKPVSGGGRSEMKMEDSAGGADAARDLDGMTKDLQAQDKMGNPSSAAGVRVASGDVNDSRKPGVGASESMTVGGSQTQSGLPTGKRQHKPMVSRGYYDQSMPPASGSLTVLASLPGCRVGARYPSLTLSGGGKSFTLQDVTVASCGATAGDSDDRPTEEVAFYYNKIAN